MGKKRYTLVVSEELFGEVQKIADAEATTILEIIRRFIKLGLIITEVQSDPNKAFIFRADGKDQEILLL